MEKRMRGAIREDLKPTFLFPLNYRKQIKNLEWR